MNQGTGKYGYCKRSEAWVLRDAMLGFAVRAYLPDGSDRRFTIRLAPAAHAELLERLEALAWQDDLRTRDELESQGAKVLEVVPVETTDTAAWYRSRTATDSDDDILARRLLSGLNKSSSLEAMRQVINAAKKRIKAEALMREVRKLAPKLRRWDNGVANMVNLDRIVENELHLEVQELDDYQLVSADMDQILIVFTRSYPDVGLMLHEVMLDHGYSQLAHQRMGKLAAADVAVDN